MPGKYYLISKNSQSFVKYSGKTIRLSKSFPYTVDEVVVGIKNKPNKVKKITTFRDSNGKVIERAFDYPDKPLRNRIYTRKDYTIGNDEFVNSTTVKEFTLKRSIINVYNEFKERFKSLNIQTTLWNKEKIQTNHISENINTGDKIFSRVDIENIKQPSKQLHRFIEYPPIIKGKVQKRENKSLTFRVNGIKSEVVDGTIENKGVKIPKKDSYLAYRALDIDDAKEPLTKRFIKERNLGKLKLQIKTNYVPEENKEKLCALFWDGKILFNELFHIKSKANLAKTAKHEVEHGWQYYLDARNTGGRTPYLMELAKKFGGIRNKKLKKEAQRYTKSIENYVPFHVDYEKYKKNYIEVMADKAGLKAKNEYNKQGETIRNSFKHIPEETL